MKRARIISLTISWLLWFAVVVFVLGAAYHAFSFKFTDSPHYEWRKFYTKAYMVCLVFAEIAFMFRFVYRGILWLAQSSPRRPVYAYALLPIATLFTVVIAAMIVGVGVELFFYRGLPWYFVYCPIVAILVLGLQTPYALLPRDLRKS